MSSPVNHWKKFAASLSIPAVLFYVLVAFDSTVSGFYVFHRGAIPEAFGLLYKMGVLWVVIWWLKEDSRKRGVKLVYCLGLLVYVGFLIILPYHLFKTRGAGGMLIILSYVAVVVAGHILGAMLYALFISL
jgi:hypothetical protein